MIGDNEIDIKSRLQITRLRFMIAKTGQNKLAGEVSHKELSKQSKRAQLIATRLIPDVVRRQVAGPIDHVELLVASDVRENVLHRP